jgi:hypothetical protein
MSPRAETRNTLAGLRYCKWRLAIATSFTRDTSRLRSDLLAAIQAHSSPGSKANVVIQLFDILSTAHQQEILNFLRSL